MLMHSFNHRNNVRVIKVVEQSGVRTVGRTAQVFLGVIVAPFAVAWSTYYAALAQKHLYPDDYPSRAFLMALACWFLASFFLTPRGGLWLTLLTPLVVVFCVRLDRGLYANWAGLLLESFVLPFSRTPIAAYALAVLLGACAYMRGRQRVITPVTNLIRITDRDGGDW